MMEWVPHPTTWVKIRCPKCKSVVELLDGTIEFEFPVVDRRVAVS